MTIYKLHEVDDEKLENVKSEMRIMGAPSIKAVEISDMIIAIEGVHRITAAKELGYIPNIEVISCDDAYDYIINQNDNLADDLNGWDRKEFGEWLMKDAMYYTFEEF